MLSTMFMISYFTWRTTFVSDHERDDYMSSKFFTEFSQRDPYSLKGGDFEFKVAIVDTKFQNEDNPYGEFKLHKYSSIRDYNSILTEGQKPTLDEIVELRDCNYGKSNDTHTSGTVWDLKQTYYCPVWKDNDFLYGNYYSDKTAWYRLAMHECDPEERAKVGKTCKS